MNIVVKNKNYVIIGLWNKSTSDDFYDDTEVFDDQPDINELNVDDSHSLNEDYIIYDTDEDESGSQIESEDDTELSFKDPYVQIVKIK
jgi:hypothetical protein